MDSAETLDTLATSLETLTISGVGASAGAAPGGDASSPPSVSSIWLFIKQLQSSSSAARVGSGPTRASFLGELLLEYTVLQVCVSGAYTHARTHPRIVHRHPQTRTQHTHARRPHIWEVCV